MRVRPHWTPTGPLTEHREVKRSSEIKHFRATCVNDTVVILTHVSGRVFLAQVHWALQWLSAGQHREPKMEGTSAKGKEVTSGG